ncbi:hypothetical protein BU26DRAFT_523708 [Trematosphaeria pertusa]|uniref:F-box domain-containing protein n=1 Tax=Trematosphaeria pertusa TaxID=390896 RepID=A0A6A6HYS8_9PLEO|nr:uncharacterized protein BU26DRAFT_523708 [Trematosphaeria pertusa]KAF2243384.1 hypothetical protein BU26DRAFT_523708 [Trematosphaeria pertusa]
MPASKKRKEKRKAQRALAPAVWARQPNSQLLQLPGELRDTIYKWVLGSTRLTFGERSTSRICRKRMRSAPTALALLRICRQVYRETRPLWIGLVLFNFETPKALLDTLSPLPTADLSKVRHVRMSGMSLMIQPIDHDDVVFYRTASVLQLLPHLRLDTLTVLACPYGEVAYDTLNGLVDRSNGWRELRYICPNSSMLGFKAAPQYDSDPFSEKYRRKPQPSAWNAQIGERDGGDSGASVMIDRSILINTPGSIIHPRNREPFVQVPTKQDGDRYGNGEERDLIAGPGLTKELLVVVKRGHGANIAENTNPPFDEATDIRAWSGSMSWKEIKKATEWIPSDEEDDGILAYSAPRTPEEIDTYEDVDDIQWPNIS